MNRKQAKELLPIIIAFAEGKEVQYQWSDGRWKESENLSFGRSEDRYRIAPESVKVTAWAVVESTTGVVRDHFQKNDAALFAATAWTNKGTKCIVVPLEGTYER